MTDQKQSIDRLLDSLKERAKELNCLYSIEELLKNPDADADEVFEGVIQVIPPGWQYPDVCKVRLEVEGTVYKSPDFEESPWSQTAQITVQDTTFGSLCVYYIKEMPQADIGPFLKEEEKLIGTIADRIAHFLMWRRLRHVSEEWVTAQRELSEHKKAEWQVILDLLRQTDKELFLRISQKMLNHLCWSGIQEAENLRLSISPSESRLESEIVEDLNQPDTKRLVRFTEDVSDKTFRIANNHLSDDEILSRVQKWIHEDKLGFLAQVVNRNLSLSDVTDAVRRYYHIAPEGLEVHSPSSRGIQVSLIRRILSDQLDYINIAKNYTDLGDFYHLLQKVIFAPESRGKLGGKSAGVFLATQILKKSKGHGDIFDNLKVPKTWYITSDTLLDFMHYNNFDEIVEQKYKEIDLVRLEYRNIIQTFKNSHFPPEVIKGLSVALDDFKDASLIVRSSSLLEDRMGAAFSGKYKSLFLANRGTKQERLEALMDAIAEVYASTFGPDPIEYRAERGLLDFGEEMGIMIQEVVGKKVGDYFLPAFAGVAFSRNEFRWSPRIKRKDGLVRLVPGLGTRAVDRTADDYPILIAPGQPGLRVNVSVDEMVRYSPKKVDVINLKTHRFETIEISKLVKEFGDELPAVEDMFSIYEDGHMSQANLFNLDPSRDDLVVTFDGLISRTKFVTQMKEIMSLLEEKLNTPVDIEFAHDGKNFYLLQCRPQSSSDDDVAAPIPKNLSKKEIIFTANRYISNGRVPHISHIVYVDPEKYGEIGEKNELVAIGNCIGKLNELLPKRHFILMGPGRWGSRGDIKLGVNVTYSDINNTAVLIEIARKKGNYVPDLSFGTHFFQDLVESKIRYIPLYPDDEGVQFNELFLTRSKNFLSEVLPEFKYLEDVVRLIAVKSETDGRVLQILMNADLDEAVGVIADPQKEYGGETRRIESTEEDASSDGYWRWRMGMAEEIANRLEPEEFGVAGLYVFGSTKNGTAGPGSDIDLLIHFRGTEDQKERLKLWLEGWSQSLDEMNYLQTGYRTGGLLDLHFVTDEDIKNKTSYASKIGAVTDAARPLKINGDEPA